VHGSAVPASYLVTQFEGKRLCAGRSQWSLGKRIADRTVTRETPSPINIVEMTSAGSSPLSLARQCGLYGVISVHVCSKKIPHDDNLGERASGFRQSDRRRLRRAPRCGLLWIKHCDYQISIH
jgi:hypothetical protein